MIETLRIERIAIVDQAELEFGPGLNVLTGETGAGKSVVLGALGLLAGARAPGDALPADAEDGAVEAVFRTDGHAALECALDERGLSPEPAVARGGSDERTLVVRRSLHRNGRSRARVAGQLVPIATLSELFDGRLEISSQHSSQALLRPEHHGRLLDEAGGLLPLRAELEAAFAQLRALDGELEELRARSEERARRQDFLAFQLREIDEVGLGPNELDELAAEHARLAHAERLREEGGAAAAALTGDAARPDSPSASDLLAQSLRWVQGLAHLDPSLERVVERLQALETELRDVGSDLERYVDGIEADPARLTRVEDRLGQIERLRRKYGQVAEEILAHRAAVAAELDSIEGADARIALAERERAAGAKALGEIAARLSAARAEAAEKLQRKVQRSLRQLSMPRARFEVALHPAPESGFLAGVACGPGGAESPQFQFSANAGQPPLPLAKVASGGELSRVFLSIKNALRRVGAGMVLVFDEVDAGIGGRAADQVGRTLAELAGHHQVLCITHLPQIAAFADVHFRVEKRESARRTAVSIERVEGDARVEEIARMAGGESVSEATREHARELLVAKH